MKFALCAFLSILLLLSATRADPSDYVCPGTCNSSPTCHCGSSKPPGGLKPEEVPQFIVLTNDDSVSVVTYPVIRGITDKHKNRNGCVMPATWFVQTKYTDANLIRQLYMDNHEIATHTVTHPNLPGVEEIVGARTWLNQTANVPLEKIQGFRAPFLSHDPQQRKVLQQNGFLYDSSITEQFGKNQASPNENSKIWPFTMDHGIPIDCTVGTGTCDPNESNPGLWEFPMWSVQGADGLVIASMDPQGDNFEQYKREFERNYYGGRAPVGIYLHAGLLMAFSEHQGQIGQFLEWALTHEDVWLVTAAEVLRWMKNPVPASEYQFDCTTPTDMEIPGGQICFEPSGGCAQGTWSNADCACKCQYRNEPRQNGYCPDSSGVCTIAKLYDDATQLFRCPGDSTAPSLSPRPQDPWAPAPVPAPAPAPSSSPSIEEPPIPVTVAFYVLGSKVADIKVDQAADICKAVTRIALENPARCTITNATDATEDGGEARVLVEVTINTPNPDTTMIAINTAGQTGTLAASLKAAGVTFDSMYGAPSPAPVQPPTGGSQEPAGSGGSNTGAIVGGVVGGIVGLAALTVFLVMRHIKAKKRERYAGSSAKAAEASSGPSGPISVVATFREAHSTSYNSSPRSQITPAMQWGAPTVLEDSHRWCRRLEACATQQRTASAAKLSGPVETHQAPPPQCWRHDLLTTTSCKLHAVLALKY